MKKTLRIEEEKSAKVRELEELEKVKKYYEAKIKRIDFFETVMACIMCLLGIFYLFSIQMIDCTDERMKAACLGIEFSSCHIFIFGGFLFCVFFVCLLFIEKAVDLRRSHETKLRAIDREIAVIS